MIKEARPRKFGEFVAVMWEGWSKRNRFIFGRSGGGGKGLAARAVTFVRNSRDFNAQSQEAFVGHPMIWKPLDQGFFELNFDARKVGMGLCY